MKQHLINILAGLVDMLCNCEYSMNALPINDNEVSTSDREVR
jgi:hypothetical protein